MGFMMKKRLWSKLLASLLVMTLILTNFMLLGVYASNVYAISDRLENQKILTNNENIVFDAYFKDSKGNVQHTIRESFEKQDIQLYIAIAVKKGYIKNASIQVLGENKTSSNFRIKNSNNHSEYIESIDEVSNVIHLKQIGTGAQILLEVPIEALKEDVFDLTNFSKINDIVLTGTYIGNDGKESKIENTVQIKNEWVGQASASLEQQLVRFIPYEVNRKTGTILQTVVKSGMVNHTLPIKQTNMVIEVPVVNGKMPKEVRVTALGVLVTNGKRTITNEEWSYDAQRGFVMITLKNEAVEGKIAWPKQGQDELLVTYLYDEKVDAVEAKTNATASIEAYNMVETKLPFNHELTISQNETLGNIVETTVQTTESLSKGYLYRKVEKEIGYTNQVTTDITYPELVDTITLTQDMDYFVDEVGKIAPTTIGNTNYAYYKTTKMNAQNFKEILGEEGSIQIVTLQGEELGVWNKDTITDENGDYILRYEKETNQIKMITSKPIAIGKLVIKHEKVLKGNTDYTKEQIATFKTLNVKAQVEAKANVLSLSKQETTNGNVTNEQVKENQAQIVISTMELEKNITLVEPMTKIETSVSNENLSTMVKNENVELRVLLKTNDITCDLYKNPKIEIVLPSYIEKLEIKDINLLFDNELTIKNYHTYVNAQGNIVIYVEIQGEQTTYSNDEITKGANLMIHTDITLKELTPTKDDVMEVYIVNEFATNYEQVANVQESTKLGQKRSMQTMQAQNVDKKGYSQTILKAVAPFGVVTKTSISNYNVKNETITSIGSNEQIGKLDVKKEARMANVNMSIINNYPNPVNQMMVLGRIPTKGSTNVDTLEDFNSNLATSMALEGITYEVIVPESEENNEVMPVHDVIDVNSIYYSENPSATKELSLASNGWKRAEDVQDYNTIKSYLIVLGEEVSTGTVINMNYELQIPENISYNMGAYSNFVVYFNNQTKEGNLPQKEIAGKIGLETGEGPELEVSIHSDKEGKEVEEREIITYTINVKNIGKSEVKQVSVSGSIPEKTVYTYIEEQEGEGATTKRIYDTQTQIYSKMIESIPVGETKTLTYQVETRDLGVGYDKNGEVIYVEEHTIQNTAKATVQGYDTEFLSEPIGNKLIQGYVTLNLEVATIPAEYVRKEGDKITYLILLNNCNGVEKKNLQLVTTLPEGITFYNANENGRYDKVTRQVIWNIETLAGNESKYYQLTVEVNSLQNHQYEKTITTKASILGEKTIESNTVSILVQKANLTITQSSSTKSPVSVGETIIYNFEIKNEGTGNATNVKLVDNLPEGLKYELAQYSYNGQTYSSKLGIENKAEIVIGGLEAGQTLSVSIKATVEELANGVEQKQITNQATVTAEGLPEVTSNEITHIIKLDKNNGTNDPSTDTIEKGTHSISGVAWLDENGDGKHDEKELKMSNIPVILINADNGKIVQDITTKKDKRGQTNERGEYTFANLKPGKYMVVFLYDSGNYGLTLYKQSGVNEDQNSDFVQMNVIYEEVKRIAGVSDKLSLSDKNIENIDLGLIASPKFDLKLDKVISRITVSDVNGTDVYDYKNEKIAKMDLKSKTAIGSTVMIEYKIRVTNEGAVAGYVKKIVDYMPKDMRFSSELNKDWYVADNGTNLYNTSLANTILNPGETKEVTLLLTKKMTESNMGIIHNVAEIAETYNELGLTDVDSSEGNKVENEDDISFADAIIGIKTGEIYLYISFTISMVALLGVGIYVINKKIVRKQ